MKNYIVWNNSGCTNYNDIFLVKARNQKDAINTAHLKYGEGFYKQDFNAGEVEKLFLDGESIVVIR